MEYGENLKIFPSFNVHVVFFFSLSKKWAGQAARINVQVGKISKINNCADWNKDVQAGIFIEINKLCSTIIWETRVSTF